jgi:hypothetical protein
MRLGGPRGRSGQVRNTSTPPKGLNPRTFQLVANVVCLERVLEGTALACPSTVPFFSDVTLPHSLWLFSNINKTSVFNYYIFIIRRLRAGRSGDWIPVGARFPRTCSDRPWGPPSLLYNGYRVFLGGKERPGRDADPSPFSSAVGHERVELYLYSPYRPCGLYRASVPVQGCPLPLLWEAIPIWIASFKEFIWPLNIQFAIWWNTFPCRLVRITNVVREQTASVRRGQ